MDGHPRELSLDGPQSEQTPLLGDLEEENEKIKVAPLKYSEVSKAADTVQRAFVDDAIMNYYGSADTAPFFSARWRLRHNATFLDGVHQGRILTVNQGQAVLEYGAPGNDTPSKVFELFFRLLESFDTSKLTSRKTEFRGKIREFVREAFGSKVKEMYSLQVLATAPEAQGRGYATALVNAVTEQAEAEGRDTWVITAGASKFYQQLGFHIVCEGVLGADNPAWDGEPIPIFVLRKDAGRARSSTLGPRVTEKPQ